MNRQFSAAAHRSLLTFALVLCAAAAGESTTKPSGDGVMDVKFVSFDPNAEWGALLTVDLVNVSGKRIEAIKGSIRFYDRFGDEIDGGGVEIDDAIDAGKTFRKAGYWGLEPRANKLLQEPGTPNITLRWKTSKVAYAE